MAQQWPMLLILLALRISTITQTSRDWRPPTPEPQAVLHRVHRGVLGDVQGVTLILFNTRVPETLRQQAVPKSSKDLSSYKYEKVTLDVVPRLLEHH